MAALESISTMKAILKGRRRSSSRRSSKVVMAVLVLIEVDKSKQ